MIYFTQMIVLFHFFLNETHHEQKTGGYTTQFHLDGLFEKLKTIVTCYTSEGYVETGSNILLKRIYICRTPLAISSSAVGTKPSPARNFHRQLRLYHRGILDNICSFQLQYLRFHLDLDLVYVFICRIMSVLFSTRSDISSQMNFSMNIEKSVKNLDDYFISNCLVDHVNQKVYCQLFLMNVR